MKKQADWLSPKLTRRIQVFVILIVAISLAVVPYVLLMERSAERTEDEILSSRLRLAKLAGAEADRVVAEAFFELELIIGASAVFEGEQAGPLRTTYQRVASFSDGVLMLDGNGVIILAEPPSLTASIRGPEAQTAIEEALVASDRTVSRPFTVIGDQRPMAALGVPNFDGDGSRAGTLIGLFNLGEPLVTDLLEPIRLLGPTGHADLVDERGFVVASTEHDRIMTQGDHPDFYTRMAKERVPTIERVAHEPEDRDPSAWHTMAYVPLRNAPWGLALGASEGETMAAARGLRRDAIVAAIAAGVVLVAATSLITFLVPSVRPH